MVLSGSFVGLLQSNNGFILDLLLFLFPVFFLVAGFSCIFPLRQSATYSIRALKPPSLEFSESGNISGFSCNIFPTKRGKSGKAFFVTQSPVRQKRFHPKVPSLPWQCSMVGSTVLSPPSSPVSTFKNKTSLARLLEPRGVYATSSFVFAFGCFTPLIMHFAFETGPAF